MELLANPIGVPEILILFFAVFIVAIPVAIIVIIVRAVQRPHQLPSSGVTPVDQLERLNSLKDRGALTDDEFARAKSEILDGNKH